MAKAEIFKDQPKIIMTNTFIQKSTTTLHKFTYDLIYLKQVFESA